MRHEERGCLGVCQTPRQSSMPNTCDLRRGLTVLPRLVENDALHGAHHEDRHAQAAVHPRSSVCPQPCACMRQHEPESWCEEKGARVQLSAGSAPEASVVVQMHAERI